MSEHELWNEVGNLYFKTGSYSQAIGAYVRAIDLDQGFGRSYTNMALAYVKVGRHADAITLYHRALDLMTDEYERAFTWYKLGNVYRHIKDYPLALAAFQKADELSCKQEQEEALDSSDSLLTSKRAVDDVLKVLNLEEEVIEQAIAETNPSAFDEVESNLYFEELTPWIFEGQIVPDEEPFDTDFDLMPMDVIDGIDLIDVVPMIEPLKWEVSPEFESMTNDRIIDDDSVEVEAREENPPLDVTSLTEMLIRKFMPSVDDAPVNPMPESENVESPIAAIETPEVENDHVSVFVAADDAEIVTEMPEFIAEDMTATEPLVQDEIPQSQKIVEDCSPILQEINRVKRVLEINPKNAFAWDTLGGLYKSLGQYSEAIEAFQQAVSLDPTRSYYVYHLGLVYAADGKSAEAIDAFQKVVEMNPNHSHAHATLGGYYRKQGMEDLAQVHIERARGLLDDDENEYNRACMEAICGNSDRAFNLLEIALKNKQTYTTWVRKDPDLEFIRSDSRFTTLLAEYEMGLAQ